MKKLLAVLLTLSMLAGMVSVVTVTASAESVPLEDISATVTGYEVGKTVADTQVTAPEGAPYQVSIQNWKVYDYATDSYVDFNGTFEDGRLYKVYVQFLLDDGYDATDVRGMRVNGEGGDEAVSGDLNSDGVFETIRVSYHVRHVKPIESASIIGVPEAKIGEELFYNGFSIPEDAPYTVKLVEWEDPNWDLLAPGTKFEDGKAYHLFIELEAKDGWAFHDDAIVTVNGKEAFNTYPDVRIMRVQTYFTFRKQITSIEVTGLSKPAAGQKADFEVTAKMNGEPAAVSVRWMDENNNPVTEFGEKGIYDCMVAVEVPDGYEVPWETAFMLDGKEVTLMLGSAAFGIKRYYVGYPVMKKLDVTIDGFEKGKAAGDAGITIENCQASILNWGETKTGLMEDAEPFSGVFTEEGKYVVVAYLRLPEGYIVDDTTQIYVNGRHYPKASATTDFTGTTLRVLPLTLKEPTTPETGDNTPVFLLGAVMVLSAVMLIALPVARKRREN